MDAARVFSSLYELEEDLLSINSSEAERSKAASRWARSHAKLVARVWMRRWAACRGSLMRVGPRGRIRWNVAGNDNCNDQWQLLFSSTYLRGSESRAKSGFLRSSADKSLRFRHGKRGPLEKRTPPLGRACDESVTKANLWSS
jgi:hypothetical protein